MLTIPSGSQVIIPGVLFIYRDFLANVPGSCLYNETGAHLKETSSGTRGMARYGVPYTYKGRPLPAFPFTPFLQRLQVGLQWVLNVPFNAAVVNRYRDGGQSVPPHSDSTAIPQLGKQPVIAGLSFGSTRDFVMCGLKKSSTPIVIPVNQGDLYVMHGQSQSHYRHSIPCVSTPVGPRWSVTFRHHVTQ
jgi:alkylated DNA repair dioxygenase AlkB